MNPPNIADLSGHQQCQTHFQSLDFKLPKWCFETGRYVWGFTSTLGELLAGVNEKWRLLTHRAADIRIINVIRAPAGSTLVYA